MHFRADRGRHFQENLFGHLDLGMNCELRMATLTTTAENNLAKQFKRLTHTHRILSIMWSSTDRLIAFLIWIRHQVIVSLVIFIIISTVISLSISVYSAFYFFALKSASAFRTFQPGTSQKACRQ